MPSEQTIRAQDSDGYQHVMRRVAHRVRSLCGYLDLDQIHLAKGENRLTASGFPCGHCELLATEGT